MRRGDDPRALRAEREDHLGYAERLQQSGLGAADERLGLLVVQLEHLDVAEDVADVLVRMQRADRRRANEPLEVDEEASPVRGEGRERLRREVGARQCADVDPGARRLRPATACSGDHGSPTASCHMIRRSPS